MKNKFDEKTMVLRYCKALEKKNIQFTVEVPFFNRSIDLVFYDKKGNICAIEFKLSNWRKGIMQAKDCALGANRYYLCLPEEKINNNIKEITKENNCGLIGFDVKTGRIRTIHSFLNKNYLERGQRKLCTNFKYATRNANYNILQSLV